MSELVNTNCDSQAFLAPLSLDGCYRSGGSLTGFSSESAAAPQRMLSTTAVTPREPLVGAALTLSSDVPAGSVLLWDIAVSEARPNTSQEPLRFYGDPATVTVLPAIHIFQSSMTVPIPTSSSLVNMEFYAQGISLPFFGQGYLPTVYLPRGERVTIR